jgi:hypothetical protein
MEISSVCSNSKTHARLSAGPLLDCTTDQLPSRIARLSPGMESSSLYAIRSVRVKRLSNIRTPRPAAPADTGLLDSLRQKRIFEICAICGIAYHITRCVRF